MRIKRHVLFIRVWMVCKLLYVKSSRQVEKADPALMSRDVVMLGVHIHASCQCTDKSLHFHLQPCPNDQHTFYNHPI